MQGYGKVIVGLACLTVILGIIVLVTTENTVLGIIAIVAGPLVLIICKLIIRKANKSDDSLLK
ncbi:MAG: hypothetical protein FWC68_05060 [Oscillospiraceae bacterium]|nr:hypothetical protein [Oscillospiraceae bacterium]